MKGAGEMIHITPKTQTTCPKQSLVKMRDVGLLKTGHNSKNKRNDLDVRGCALREYRSILCHMGSTGNSQEGRFVSKSQG